MTGTPYDDIIGLPHHVSVRHPRMSRHDRAAQFAPFSALVGYKECLAEESRLTEARQDLESSRQEDIDSRLRYLAAVERHHPEVAITCFVPDGRKVGGAYVTFCGRVSRLDAEAGTVILENGEILPFRDIVALKGKVFDSLEG